MVDRVIRLEGRGLRGDSYADVARRSGLFGILPTDDDETVIGKINADASASAERAELAAEQAADLVLPENRFVAADLATARADGEAATTAGTYFIAVGELDGEAEVRLRTAGGSDLIYTEITKAALASTAPGKGADLIGYSLNVPGAVSRTVADRLADVVNAADFGVAEGNSAAENALALQAAIDYCLDPETKEFELVLPAGEIALEGDVTVNAFLLPSGTVGRRIFRMRGQGPGYNGSWLHFSTGSLIIHAYHDISDFRVTSDADDGIVIGPFVAPAPVRYPVRSSMQNVRAEYCGGSGISLSSSWIYLMVNCYARYNNEWGIEGRPWGAGPFPTLAANGWTIIGGELQGNGTKQGTPVGPNGSTERGTGGGMFTGSGIEILLLGTTIEGNVGDGLKIGPTARGVTLMNVYFEKNGSHHTNRDICNDPPATTATRPSGVYVQGCNFTPQEYSGLAQERAIELYDVQDLKIKQVTFFSSSVSGTTLGFSQSPIYVGENFLNSATGWVEGVVPVWSGYNIDTILENDTNRFGFPRIHEFSPDTVMPSGVDTDTPMGYVDMPGHYGRRVDIDYDIRPITGTGNMIGQTFRIQTRISRGPTGVLQSSPSSDHEILSASGSVKNRLLSFNEDYVGNSVEVVLRRVGTHSNDTAGGSVRAVGCRATVYAGVVDAAAIC